MSDSQQLLEHANDLLKSVERVRSLSDLLATEDGGDLRRAIILNMTMKVLPELEAGKDLPIFIGVQGGANVGKSTVFNALAGMILSPSVVLASATKHPLVFLHKRWKKRFLKKSTLPAYDCRELADPKELLADADRTDLLFLRFHDDDSLKNLALIDSPDFDSVLETNLQVALGVVALSDVTLFVTTAQKYRDRDLVARLRQLAKIKTRVLLVFNMVDQEVVFRTLVNDLEDVLPLKKHGIRALRLPNSREQHPEEELSTLLRSEVLAELTSFVPSKVKPTLVRRTIDRVLEQVEKLRELFVPELRFKSTLLERSHEALEDGVKSYARSFNLAFPEETIAIRRLIDMTRIGPWFQLPQSIEAGSGSLKVIAMGLRRFNEGTRDLFVRLSRSSVEGMIEDTPAALADYAANRDETDFQSVLRAAENLRIAIETHCRGGEDGSPLAREILAAFFTPEWVAGYSERVRTSFDEAIADRDRSGETILGKIASWRERHPLLHKTIIIGCTGLKVAAGVLLAWVIPPDGIFDVFNWLWFVLGYFFTAYAMALCLTVAVRRRKRFRAHRIRCARKVLEEVFEEPLKKTADELLSAADLEALEKAAKRLGENGE